MRRQQMPLLKSEFLAERLKSAVAFAFELGVRSLDSSFGRWCHCPQNLSDIHGSSGAIVLRQAVAGHQLKHPLRRSPNHVATVASGPGPVIAQQ